MPWLHRPAKKASLDPRVWQSSQEAVPKAAQAEVLRFLGRGEYFRKGLADLQSPVTVCEKALAQYVGLKYCVALTSYGSTLFVALKAAGVKHGVRVLTSALAAKAVPSAVLEAGGECVLVESTRDLVVDIGDLRAKAERTRARHFVLSHVHGHIANLDDVVRECRRLGIVIVEDCADSLGAWWDGRHIGHYGVVSCFSARAPPAAAAGGGFALTDDVGLAAGVAALAGCYDADFKRHFAAAESPVLGLAEQGAYPNYSLQMSNLTAAVLRPQITSLERRVRDAARRDRLLAERLASSVESRVRGMASFHVPEAHPKAKRCGTAFAFLADLAPEASAHLLATARARGVPLQAFAGTEGGWTAAMLSRQRPYRGETSEVDNGPDLPECSRTSALRKQLFIVCIPPRLSDANCLRAADVLAGALAEAAEMSSEARRATRVLGPCVGPACAPLLQPRGDRARDYALSIASTPASSAVVPASRRLGAPSPAGSQLAGSTRFAWPAEPPEGPAVSDAAKWRGLSAQSVCSSVALSARPASVASYSSHVVGTPTQRQRLVVRGASCASSVSGVEVAASLASPALPQKLAEEPALPSRSVASTASPVSGVDDSPWSSGFSRAGTTRLHGSPGSLSASTRPLPAASGAPARAPTAGSLGAPTAGSAVAPSQQRPTARVCSSWAKQARGGTQLASALADRLAASAAAEFPQHEPPRMNSCDSEETLAPLPSACLPAKPAPSPPGPRAAVSQRGLSGRTGTAAAKPATVVRSHPQAAARAQPRPALELRPLGRGSQRPGTAGGHQARPAAQAAEAVRSPAAAHALGRALPVRTTP